MKKLLNFSSFIALLGIVALLVGLSACAQLLNAGEGPTAFNLFTATFGGTIFYTMGVSEVPFDLAPCGGLIVAFVLTILGIIASIATFKSKLAALLSGGLFIASGVLVLCSSQLLFNTNIHGQAGVKGFENLPGAIAIGVLLLVAGTLSLIYFLTTIFKPKKQETY